ncbi:MAG: LysM peptidoglycan-binding domain-containing protein [Bacteroidota bacterium]
MKARWLILLVLASLAFGACSALAQDMSMEQWQQEMERARAQVNDLTRKAADLRTQLDNMRGESSRLDADLQACMDELYALVGSDAGKAAAYRAEIEAAERKANDLIRLSDADLLARSGEVDELEATVKRLWQNKLSLIPEFWDRLTALDQKVASLRTTLGGSGKTYTVGTWSRDRDCLWNISKKRDIYNDAWLWPKIWQGNRDQIRDPDVIHPGQKLKIPPKGELTGEEKSAARTYYRRKSGS